MDFRAVLFDMDGVLMHSFEAWLSLMNAAAKHFGRPPISRDSFRAVYGQPTSADVEMYFPTQTEEEVEAYYDAHFHEHASASEVSPEAAPVMEALKERGLGVAVITNTPSSLAKQMLDAASLEPDVLIGGSDVPNAKPAPDIIFRACELLGVEPWDVLVVGDSRYDKQAAAAAASPFAGIGGLGGNFTIQDLQQVLDIVDGNAV
ncbi:MAG: HAD family hydrolase [Dehalococcoidia bacterium]